VTDMKKLLVIVNLVMVVFLGVLFMNSRLMNEKLKNFVALLDLKINSQEMLIRKFQGIEQEKAQLEQKVLEFLKWQGVIRQRAQILEEKFLGEIVKAEGVKKNKPLKNILNYNLGLAYLLAIDFDSAEKAFEEAIRFDPNDTESRYMLERIRQNK